MELLSIKALIGGGGGASTPTIVGFVKQGSTMPTTRPSGDALVLGDYVKVDSTATLPFTIGTLTFTSMRDTGVYMGASAGWSLNASAFQYTNETPVKTLATESISGTATQQSDINIENANEIKKLIKSFSISDHKLKGTTYDGNTIDVIDLDQDATQNSTNGIESNGVWKGQLNNTGSKLELDQTDTTKDKIVLTLKNNANNEVVKATLDLTDVLVLLEKTQTLKNKTINADDNTIQNITGTNLKSQATTDKGKTWVVKADGTWELGKAGSEVDNATLEENADGKIQIKDKGVSYDKLEDGTDTKGIKVDKLNTTAVSKSIPKEYDATVSDKKLTTEKAVSDAIKKDAMIINNKTIAIDGNYIVKTGLVEDKNFKVVSKKTTSGTVYFDFEEITTPPTLTSFTTSPTTITSGVSTTITLSISATKGTKDLSKATISYNGTTIDITGLVSGETKTTTVNISNATSFSCIVYDTDNNASEMKYAYVIEDTPTYNGFFGSAVGGTNPISLTSQAYTGTITMTNDKIVYKYPATMNDLTSITSGGINYLSFFTKTTEIISGTSYKVYTQNANSTVTNFSISFA